MAFTPFTKEEQPTMANFNVKFLDAIQEAKTQALDAGIKIATGSYTGTGTYGASNPNSLTFDFEPKLLFVARKNFAYNNILWFKDVTHALALHSYASESNGTSDQTSISGSKVVVTASGNTVSWYSSNGAEAQLNSSDFTYQYVAIG